MGHGADETKKHILLVEDHEDTLKVLARLLERRGYVVATATTAEEAMDAFLEEEFDLLISDIGLPDQDGKQMLRDMRDMHPIKAIAVTAYCMPDEIQACRTAGYDDVLKKPMDFFALLASIISVLGNGNEASTQAQLLH